MSSHSNFTLIQTTIICFIEHLLKQILEIKNVLLHNLPIDGASC
jgi:hypothetical protein